MEYSLNEIGFKTASLHGEIPSHRRAAEYNSFLERRATVLIATDLAARGLDFPFVSHVVNFDFPRSASDYLHRAGRAGRAGREGFVMNLYRNKDMDLIKEMRSAHNENMPLKIKGSAYALRNKEELIRERIKDRKGRVSMPEEWKESRNVKRIKDKEKRDKLLKEK